MFIVIVAIVFACRHAIAEMIRRRKLASVLAELDRAYDRFRKDSSTKDLNEAGLAFLAETNRLLNRVVLVMYPDSNGANLTGEHWLAFLDACDNSTVFSQGDGKVLGDGMYRPAFDADADALYQVAKQWIEHRYTEKTGNSGTLAPSGSVIA